MIIVFLLLSLLLNFLLIVFVLKSREKTAEIKRTYQILHGKIGLDNVLTALSAEISRMGLDVVDFVGADRKMGQLTGNKGNVIPINEKSDLIKSFFTQQPLVSRDVYEIDKKLKSETYKEKVLSYIPIQMGSAVPCWRANHCEAKTCSCITKSKPICWLESDKCYRGEELESYSEKTARCFRCNSFLPIGVFVVKGKAKLYKIHKFISNNFSGLLKNAVTFEKVFHSATKDHLTGVLNKRSLMANLHAQYNEAQRYDQHLSICFFDIDHFKKLNDKYGHPTGDLVLRDLAQLVGSSVRETDWLARYGGEEFVIMLPHTEKDAALKVAEDMRKKVANNKFRSVDGEEITVKISLGVSSFPEDFLDIDSGGVGDLIKKADSALYHAKIERNMVCGFNAATPLMPKETVKKEQKEKQEGRVESSKKPSVKTAKKPVQGEKAADTPETIEMF